MENKWTKKFRITLDRWLHHENLDHEWCRQRTDPKDAIDSGDVESLSFETVFSILKSMPAEIRLSCLSELLEPLGLEVRRRHASAASEHRWMDEIKFAYTSMLEVMDTPDLDIALEALEDAIEAKREARWKLEMALANVQDVRETTRLS